MSKSKLNQNTETINEDSNWKNVSTIGGIAAFLSFVCVLITMTVIITIGGEPSTATEYFTLLNNDRIVGLLRMDFAICYKPGLLLLDVFWHLRCS